MNIYYISISKEQLECWKIEKVTFETKAQLELYLFDSAPLDTTIESNFAKSFFLSNFTNEIDYISSEVFFCIEFRERREQKKN